MLTTAPAAELLAAGLGDFDTHIGHFLKKLGAKGNLAADAKESALEEHLESEDEVALGDVMVAVGFTGAKAARNFDRGQAAGQARGAEQVDDGRADAGTIGDELRAMASWRWRIKRLT